MKKLIAFTCGLAIFFASGQLAAGKDLPTHPVVLIPGILGSKLCDANGAVLWGASARASLSNFHLLDMTRTGPGTVKSCGIIDKVQVLGPLYSTEAYSSLLAAMNNWGLVEGQNLFIFDYDWRQSNFDSVVAFERFVVNKLGPDKKFNIVAHSMGGYIARLYTERQGAASRVNKIVYLGTPFLGSMSTLGTLSEGWGTLPNWVAGGIDTIRHSAISFPALLELLPRYRECCSFKRAENQYVSIDVFDPQLWKENGWLPPDMRDGPLFAQFSNNLKRALQLTSTIGSPAPGALEVRFASDSRSTRFIFTALVGQTNPGPENWHFSFERGDATVPVWSAARDSGLSNLAGALQSFGEHSTIFDDDWVRSELNRELLTANAILDRPIAGKGYPIVEVTVAGKRQLWSLERLNLAPTATYVTSNSPIEALVELKFTGDARDFTSGAYKPRTLLRQDGLIVPMEVLETTSESDKGNRILKFKCRSETQSLHEGVVELVVDLPSATPNTQAKEFLVVLQ
jgi:pimeloyl-ACP methyl ester carboxylesterase